ncbi:uncharacterized protein LOC113494233 isoform X2 [Trichoplusia ni]|uniref:Uncharacterized protein LOC113494233 isoform X2 n=1 Tax=Trichoplusia ni TaxID=7111 RepID=A0A7E5VJ00_TRINI|nr:uncharacterized protein LOC113494233 isoform X2 [Trichoplusia ni]
MAIKVQKYMIIKFCSVKNCKNNNVNNPRKTFFSLPKDPELREKWKSITLEWYFLNERFVCQDHFDMNKDFFGYDVYEVFGGYLELRPDAVPRMAKYHPAHITRDVSDLDKFKRRLIRTVARLLLLEKRPEKEVWECLKRETSYECKALWSRMRALTLRKLEKLFECNDQVARIPKAARMSLTDWLMFDMVLVHQNVDVIKMPKAVKSKQDPKPLVDLLAIVKKFGIEGARGEELAQAWSAATLYYNNQGHQCSPMLLQLRWYQLKRATRDQFYNFWFAYRGMVKRLSFAEPHTPSPLQIEIAMHYRCLVTLPFPEWDQMIEKEEVILPEMLAHKMIEKPGIPVKKTPVAEDHSPDLEVIEPVIETIDLGADSDNEGEVPKSNTEQKQPLEPPQIKEEPADMDIDGPYIEEPKNPWFDEALQYTAVEHENLDKTEGVDSSDDLADAENEITQAIQFTLNQQKENMLPQITCVFGNVDDTNAILSQIDESGATINNPKTLKDVVLEQTVATDAETSINPVTNDEIIEENITIPTVNDSETAEENIPEIIEKSTIPVDVPEIVEPTVTEAPKSTEPTPEVIELDDDSDVETPKVKTEKDLPEVTAKKITAVKEFEKFSFGELSNDMSFADDGIAFVDDGIAYVDDYEDKPIKVEEKVIKDVPTIDLKLLMLPITYTTRLDDMGLKYYQRIQDKQLIDIICKQSKPTLKQAVKEKPEETKDDLKMAEDSEEETVPDSLKVKSSSYLLQKPRARTYNPIQLCKNPDFNTRLKRLTVGFLSSPRNRGLLKTCKPLTIDLGKSFERKLINGTLYLKANSKAESRNTEETRQNVSVIPSAMPAQSLIDNSKPVEIFPTVNYEPLKPSEHQAQVQPTEQTNERKKIINLPDISEIRRINQTLLTAEVSPIQVQNNMPQVQVSIVPTAQKPAPATALGMPLQKGFIDLDTSQPKAPFAETRLPNTTKCPPGVVNYEPNSRNSRLIQPKQKGPHGYLERYPDLITQKLPRVGPAWSKAAPVRKRTLGPTVPWIPKSSDPSVAGSTSKSDEALLTIDTLNKMLFLFVYDEQENDGSQKKQKVKKKKKIDGSFFDAPIPVNVEESTSQTKTPKVSIKAAEKKPKSKKEKRMPDQQSNSRTCCCWAQKKIIHMMGVTKKLPLHECVYPVCTCCCKHLLEEYALNDKLQKQAESQIRKEALAEKNKDVDKTILIEDTPSNNVNVKTATAESAIEIRDDSPEPKPDPNNQKVKIVICCPKSNEFAEKNRDAKATETTATAATHTTPPTAVEIVDKTPEVTDVNTADSPVKLIDAAIQTSISDGKTDTVIDLDESNDESFTITEGPIITDVRSEEPVKVPTSGSASSAITPPPKTDVATTCSRNLVLNVNPAPPRHGHVVRRRGRRPGTLHGATPTTVVKCNAHKKQCVNLAKSAKTVEPTPLPQANTAKQAQNTNNLQIAQKQLTPIKRSPEKIIYLNGKQTSSLSADNPIFLEKNKILLTTVKFPPNLYKFEEAQQVLKSTINPPNGVNLVLAVDGTVTYTVSPNVEVKATDMAAVPGIVAAMQQYINTAVKKSTPEPVATISIKLDKPTVDVDENDDKSNSRLAILPAGEEQTANQEATKNDNITIHISPVGTSGPKDDAEKTDTNVDKQIVNVTASLGSISDTSTPTVEVSPTKQGHDACATAKQNTDSHQEIASGQNLATGLQNTDGTRQDENALTESNLNDNQLTVIKDVSQQDVHVTATTPEQPIEPSNNTNTPEDPASKNQATKNILSDLMEMSGIFDEDVPTAQPSEATSSAPDTATPAVTIPSVLQSYAPPFNPHGYLRTQIFTSGRPVISELSPITSLCELKYACLNNGLFFKLDFETRLLMPVKVCMKSTTSLPRLPICPKVITGTPKAVIDLTEDDDASPANVVPKRVEAPVRVTSMPSIISRKNNAKPIKLIKLLPKVPNTTQGELSNPCSLLRKYPHGKQKVKQVVLLCDDNGMQVKKNTLVSEASCPIKPDPPTKIINYTMDGDNVPPHLESRSGGLDSDSSDEEPLAKKAKRKLTNMEAAKKDVINSECSQVGNIDESMEVDDAEELEPHFEIFPADENADSEEHCILGF